MPQGALAGTTLDEATLIAIFLLLLGRRYEILRAPALAALWMVVILALVSGVDYFHSFFREVYRGSPRPDPTPTPPADEPFAAPAKAPLK